MDFDYSAFKRSFQLNSKIKKYSFFLGAGASIQSGIKSATQCIWDWKKTIYDSFQSSIINTDIANDKVKEIVQSWLDKQGIFPPKDSPEEYSFYAEKAYPKSDDRNEYFRNILKDGCPSIGYRLLALMASHCIFDKIWTTNFDDMYLKATNNSPINIIDVTTDSPQRVYNNIANNQTMLIKLHGDYKYCGLKNTSAELQQQNEILMDAFKKDITQNELIVIGYSGRDKSIMESFEEALNLPNIKTIYWLGYEKEQSPPIQRLKDIATQKNKDIFYIQAPGFDSIMLDLSYLIFKEDPKMLEEIEKLKTEYNNIIQQSNFNLIDGAPKAIIQSNIIYFSMPELLNVVELPSDIDSKKLCESINQTNDCVCRVYKGQLYFLGNKEQVKSRFTSQITIHSTPLNSDVYKDMNFIKFLIRDTVIKALLNKNKHINAKGLLLYKTDAKMILDEKYHDAIRLHFGFHKGYPSIALNMGIYIENKGINKLKKKEITDKFYKETLQMQSNKYHALYIENWKSELFNDSLIFSNESIKFNFTKSFAKGKIVNAVRHKQLNSKPNPNSIQFISNEIKDPKLQFLSQNKKDIVEDFHPMRGLVNNQPYENALSSQDVINSVINIGVICPKGYQDQLYSFLSKLNRHFNVERNKDYLLDYPGFFKAYKTNINIPYKDDVDMWQQYEISDTTKSLTNTTALYHAIKDKIKIINNKCPDAVIIIYVPDEFEELKNYTDEIEQFDLHNQTKAFCIPLNIATQFINEKTVMDIDYASILWTLSLALYVKSGRIPWTIKSISDSNTAFVGIGYSINQRNKIKPIVLGCSNIYSGNGQSLKYKLSKVNDPQFDKNDFKKENPYLTENEAYDLGCKINDMCHKFFTTYPSRVVIHKRTPFKESEIAGLKNSLLRNGVKSIELLEINYSEDLNFTQIDQNLEFDSFPVNRGLAICIDDTTALLYTHGVAQSVLGNFRKFFLGGKNIPKPLRIKRYFGNSNLLTICEEILGLTRMNWNNFNLYSKLPCTVESSSIIAKVGVLLAHYDGTSFDQRLFM